MNSINGNRFGLTSLVPANIFSVQIMLIMNFTTLALSSGVSIHGPVKEMDTSSIFLDTWKMKYTKELADY